MDHDHSHHDHSMHGAASMPGMGEEQMRCSMNMLFTWDYRNVCVVFRQWQITSELSLFFTLLGIVALVAGYEALREGIRRYEAATTKRAESVPRDPPEHADEPDPDPESQSEAGAVAENTPLFLRSGQNRDDITSRAHAIKAVLYGVQNFYAFMIMLIFMTYNGWIMIAVSIGAALGYFIFGKRTTAIKDTACH
ncbi:Ctr copper transporter family-domain-containing protein [Lasiosphaeria hispida]|uniref:Copper transport protein n=1 Tax=Lasiosphaeria hispida TaxID=260671 RepID=A0AAJ0H5X4_9PEZI|nr:Ctr copper transporter family-domain-containing protein [Lasiosphaeria hispida]